MMSASEKKALIEASGLFDLAYYRHRNHDVATSPYEPFFHYVNWGADENRSPSERFDPIFYASQCALAHLAPGNCLLHYLTRGRDAGLFATPLEYTLQLTGIPVLELVQQFESWGRDCEFGLFQRCLGAEPNDLFRFSNPTPEALAQLIETDFAGYGERCHVELDQHRPRREWTVIDHDTRISRHTRIFEGDIAQEKVHQAALIWSRLLRAKTIREIAGGHKIYVLKTSQGDITEDSVAAIVRAIRSKGRGWLLWVQASKPAGRCDVAMDGLLRGYIDRLCLHGDENNFSMAGWLQVICAAWNAIHPTEVANGIE